MIMEATIPSPDDPRFSPDPAVRRAADVAGIVAMFPKLGDAGPAMGFAISEAGIECFGGLDEMLAALPTPAYEHALFLDPATDNVIVARPSEDGVYAETEGWRRLR
jgi:hypothetical protein